MAAKATLPATPIKMQKVYRRFEPVAERAHGPLADSEAVVGGGGGTGPGARVCPTAKVLRLEYGKLKSLLQSASPAAKARVVKVPRKGPSRKRSTVPPAFVELMTSPAVGLSECLIELEGRRGKLRIQWKGTTAPDLGGLSRTFWESH